MEQYTTKLNGNSLYAFLSINFHFSSHFSHPLLHNDPGRKVMPRRTRSKMSSRRKSRKSRKPTMRAIARQTFLSMAERKVKDVNESADVYANNPGLFGPFFNMTQGVAGEQRVGENIRVLSLKISISSFGPINSSRRVRYILVQTGTATDVDGVTIASYFTPVLPGKYFPTDTPFRYRILMDKLEIHNTHNGQDRGYMLHKFTKSWSKQGIQVEWAGSGSTPKYNNVWLFAISDTGTQPTASTVEVNSRLSFIDA